MPAGAYRVSGPAPGDPQTVERFTCAAGPTGWRLTSRVRTDDVKATLLGTLDVVLDDQGRARRLEITSGAVTVRGGLTDAGLEWSRDGVAHSDPAAVGFTSPSPGFLVATARLLGLAVGDRRRVRLVALAAGTLAATSVEQGWTLVDVEEHPTDLGRLGVSAYDVADLATGTVVRVHLAGDVVLAAPGIELVELVGPPTRWAVG